MAQAAFGIRTKGWKSMMFTQPHVRQALEWIRYYYLSYMGGYIRKVARNAMKHQVGPSKAPEAPHRHAGLIRDQLYYGYDARSRSLVAGPALIGRLQHHSTITIPELLERGGQVRRLVTRGLLGALYRERHYVAGAAEMFHALRPQLGKMVSMTYPERPYMRDALAAALDPGVQQRAWREARTKAAARH